MVSSTSHVRFMNSAVSNESVSLRLWVNTNHQFYYYPNPRDKKAAVSVSRNYHARKKVSTEVFFLGTIFLDAHRNSFQISAGV